MYQLHLSLVRFVWILGLVILAVSCNSSLEERSHATMLHLLQETPTLVDNPENMYANSSRIHYYDSLLNLEPDNYAYQYYRALDLLRRGD
ncbi:MAG: hypothetical protein WBA23_20200, partial [Tunicatimonas sp.]|uniref:hypothetical protein n=1 Tax=Tunicatimonas sp. TaxID=1940096 RepID=UPI003C72F27A